MTRFPKLGKAALHLPRFVAAVTLCLSFFSIAASAQNLMPVRLIPTNDSKVTPSRIGLEGGNSPVAPELMSPLRQAPTMPPVAAWILPASYSDPVHRSILGNAVQVSETPFDQQYEMAFGSFLHGRIRLDGLGTISVMESFLRGLPGSGSLPSKSATPVGHTGLSAPAMNSTYGFSLSLHHASIEDGSSALRMARRLGSIFRRG
jgi:hypothetical protein